MHGQPVSGDFPQGFDQAFSHQPGYDGGWGGGDLWGDPMGQPPSYDTHAGGYGYGANDPFAGSHGSLSIRDRGQVPPRPQDGRREGGGTKSVVDLEAEESGFAESNVPSLDQVTEQLHQQLMQSRSELARRQRQAMEVCERLLRALMEWARTRDTRYLLAAQQDIIAVQNSEGDTALHVAIINNHTDAVRALLDVLPQLPPTQTPVVDTQNHLNQAPMHLAVLTKQTDVVDLLLKAHADKMARDRNGNTPLHLAAQQGSVEMVQVLLTSPQQQQPAVPGACTHPELIMLNMAGYTPMHLAVLCGNVQTMKLLHAAGADINAADSKSGRSPLHYASEKGELGLAGFLIVQRDICVDQPDYHGNTPLHLAAGSGHVELVKLLIQGGAQINLMNNESELPLDLARLKGHAKVIELMEQYLSQEQQREEEAIAHQMGSVSIVDQQSDPTTPRPAALHPVPTIKSEPSDLWMLSSMTRLKLAILLDPWREGQDWSALAERIGLGHLVPAFKAMSSPTKDLLSFYEDMSGTIDALVGHLQDMGRTDAVNLMQIAIKEYGGSDSASANSGPMLGNPFMLNPGTASGGPSAHSSLSLPMEERRQ